MNYNLKCTSCGTDKEYTNKRAWYNAKKKIKDTGRLLCNTCSGKHMADMYSGVSNPNYKRYGTEKKHFKECSSCGDQMGYATNKLLLESIRLATICNKCSGVLYGKGKRLNDSLDQDKRLEMIAKREGYPDYKTYYATFEDRKKYHRRVWNLTYKQPIELLENFDRRGKSGIDGAYQIDHIIPIKYGFENGISAEEIAHINNLRMLTWEENISKGSKHYPYLR